jgi:hypothetical protein
VPFANEVVLALVERDVILRVMGKALHDGGAKRTRRDTVEVSSGLDPTQIARHVLDRAQPGAKLRVGVLDRDHARVGVDADKGHGPRGRTPVEPRVAIDRVDEKLDGTHDKRRLVLHGSVVDLGRCGCASNGSGSSGSSSSGRVARQQPKESVHLEQSRADGRKTVGSEGGAHGARLGSLLLEIGQQFGKGCHIEAVADGKVVVFPVGQRYAVDGAQNREVFVACQAL